MAAACLLPLLPPPLRLPRTRRACVVQAARRFSLPGWNRPVKPQEDCSDYEAKRLTAILRDDCHTAEEVLTLVADNLRQPWFNGLNACAALTRLRSLACPGFSALDPRFEALIEKAEALLPSMSARNTAMVLYCCGELAVMPRESLLQMFWKESEVKLPLFDTQHLSNALYACGKLRISPPDGWRDQFWAVSERKLSQFETQHFSNTLYACGQLGLTPPASWQAAFWAASNVNEAASLHSAESLQHATCLRSAKTEAIVYLAAALLGCLRGNADAVQRAGFLHATRSTPPACWRCSTIPPQC